MQNLDNNQTSTINANGWCSVFGKYETACKTAVALIAAAA